VEWWSTRFEDPPRRAAGADSCGDVAAAFGTPTLVPGFRQVSTQSAVLMAATKPHHDETSIGFAGVPTRDLCGLFETIDFDSVTRFGHECSSQARVMKVDS
jgi:hypothetical protein